MSDRMRVLVLSSVFPNPRQPALGVFVRERMRRVAGHCAVEVVAPVPWFPFNRMIRGAQWAGIPAVEDQDGLRVHHPRFFCVPRYGKWADGLCYAVSLAPMLARLRRRFPFDVIDAHFAYPDGLAAALLGRWLGRPVVVTLRGSIVRLSTYRLHRPQLRWALRSAARVIAVSQSLKRVAVDLGIEPERIRVIPNGVDATRFTPMARDEARRRLGLGLDRTIVVSVGGLNEGKGHHRIAAQLPDLVKQFPALLFVVVGGERPGDSARALLDRAVARHGLERHVLVAGERQHEEIPSWLAAADLFCLATRSEGWANVLLEAMACGRPVVTTRVGGNAEIVTDDRVGLLVPPDDDAALGAAIRDALGRTWDADALAARARAHSWDRAALDVVDELRLAVQPPVAEAAVAGLGRRAASERR